MAQYLWYVTRRVRNKIAHALFGDTVKGKPSWYQQHALKQNYSIKCGALNVGGLQKASKRMQIEDQSPDLLALCATHLQAHLEHSESQQFDDYHCFWSPNPSDRHFGGVGMLIKKSSFWQVKLIKWNPDHPCYTFYKDNRLLAVQLWFGRGGTSLLAYVAYGPSGARWEPSKKAYFHNMLAAIQEDRTSKGPIPAILLGDFNPEISDPHNLRFALHSRYWCDTRGDHSSFEMQSKPTCHKGKDGSRIDHIFVSPNDMSFNFHVQKLTEFKKIIHSSPPKLSSPLRRNPY